MHTDTLLYLTFRQESLAQWCPPTHAERFPYIPPLFSIHHQILLDQVSLGQVLLISVIGIIIVTNYALNPFLQFAVLMLVEAPLVTVGRDSRPALHHHPKS